MLLECGELEFALGTAKEAGKIIMELANPELKVSQKSPERGDVVTNADMASDNYIIDRIKKSFPGDAILTEESRDDKRRLGNRRVWIIDPIDGTKNFSNYAASAQKNEAAKYFAVHIGLAIDHVPVLGVVFAPATGELFYAVRGSGAYKVAGDGGPRVMKIDEKGEEKHDVVLNKNLHGMPGVDRIVAAFPHIERPYGVVYGCYLTAIADRKLDAYVIGSKLFHLKEWDACAPQVVLEEAGGAVTDLSGNALIYNKERPIFENGVIAQARKGIVPFV